MKIIICGAGSVGAGIAEYLSAEYSTTLIDINSIALTQAEEKLDVQTVLGDASDPNVLEKAGIQDTPIFIAVTDSDTINLTACQIVDSAFQGKLKIARLKDISNKAPKWFENFKRTYLPIDVIISPEQEITSEILQHLKAPFAFSVLPFFESTLYLLGIKIKPGSPFIDYPIKHLDKLIGPLKVTLFRISRGHSVWLPKENDALIAGDDAYFSVPAENIENFKNASGYSEERSGRILILGGGQVGLFLATQIESHHPHLSSTLIEHKNSKLQNLVSHLNNTIILQGDPLDPFILKEAGIDYTDHVIAVDPDDKVNILGSLLAKRYGAKKAITLVTRHSHFSLMHSLGIDKPLNPSFLTISTILKRVRKAYMNSLHYLSDDTLDMIMEVTIQPSVAAIGLTVREINQPKALVIIALWRNAALHDALPETLLEEGDRLIIVAEKNQQKKIKALFDQGT